MKKKKPLTIYEISAKAGVSIATVSRALNPHTRAKVAAHTLKRIEAVVQRTGYTPSQAARHMAGSKTRVIGVVMAHFKGVFDSDYHRKVLAGVADALIDTDYGFKLIMLKPAKGKHWDSYDFSSGENVDGLMVTHWGCFFSSPDCFKRMKTPAVVIGDPDPSMHAHRVHEDSRQGGELAAQYLMDHGHRKVLILAGSEYSTDSRARVETFMRFYKKHAPRAQCIHRLCAATDESLLPIFKEQITDKPKPPTAIFACNDDTALHALDLLNKLKIRCPRDISILGYDNDARASIAQPPLSTIGVATYELAFQGAQRLVDYLDNGSPSFFRKPTVLPVELISRKSVLNLS